MPDFAELLEPLKGLTEDICELRQIPKIVSKSLILLDQNHSLKLPKNLLTHDQLQIFGNRVSQLPTGLVLELWKTFLYHLKKSIENGSGSEADNMMALCDPLFAAFIEHACVVEQGIPERSMDKIKELIEETQEKVLNPVKDKKRLMNVQKSLVELVILAKNSRQIEIPSVLKIMSTRNEFQTLKRKFESLEDENGDLKKTKLELEQVLKENLSSLPCLVDEFTDKVVFDISDQMLSGDHDNFFDTNPEIVTENTRVQIALVFNSLSKLNLMLEKKHVSKNFLNELLQDKNTWMSDGGNSERILKSSEILTELISTGSLHEVKIDGSHKIFNVLKMIPLECIKGELESVIAIIIVWMLLLFKQTVETSGSLIQALARSLDGTFRQPTILKFIPFHILAPPISKVKISEDDEPTLDSVLSSLAKLSSTYQKTLETVFANIEIISKPLQNYQHLHEVKVATVLMESISYQLCNKDISPEKSSLCSQILKKLTKTASKESLQLMDNYSDSMKCTILRQLNAVMDSKSVTENDGIVLKKWMKCLPNFAQFSLKMLNEGSNQSQDISCKFISHLWSLREEVSKLPQDFFPNLMTLIADGKKRLTETIDGKRLITKLFLEAEPTVLEEFTTVLMSNTSKVFDANDDFSYLSNLWSIFIGLNVGDDTRLLRRDIIMQLLQILHFKLPVHEVKFYQNILIPVFNLEAAILETDKPLLHRESESMCLMNASTISLEEVLNVSQDSFYTVWKCVYRVLSSSFHKRSSSVVIPRIPVILSVLRNLLTSLVVAGDQTRKVSASDLKELVLLAHYVDRICEHIRKQKDDFARVAPYFVSDIVDCFQRVTLYTPVKANLLSAVHKLLDICDKHSVDMLAGILPTGRKDIFKHITTEYRKYFKYSGKV